MIYRDTDHKYLYGSLLETMGNYDVYHDALAYLIALDTVCREHVTDMFDFQENIIKPDCLSKGWQTGTSKNTTRLAFNLWNGYCTDGETYVDKHGYESYMPSRYYSVDNIFCCSYAPYYFQAVQLRYPEYLEHIDFSLP